MVFVSSSSSCPSADISIVFSVASEGSLSYFRLRVSDVPFLFELDVAALPPAVLFPRRPVLRGSTCRVRLFFSASFGPILDFRSIFARRL